MFPISVPTVSPDFCSRFLFPIFPELFGVTRRDRIIIYYMLRGAFRILCVVSCVGCRVASMDCLRLIMFDVPFW